MKFESRLKQDLSLEVRASGQKKMTPDEFKGQLLAAKLRGGLFKLSVFSTAGG
jgi:hypothetical protein